MIIELQIENGKWQISGQADYRLLRVKQQVVVCSAFLRRKGDRLSISRLKDKVVCEPITKVKNKRSAERWKVLDTLLGVSWNRKISLQ